MRIAQDEILGKRPNKIPEPQRGGTKLASQCPCAGTVSALPLRAKQDVSRVSGPREAQRRTAWFWRCVLLGCACALVGR
jgi:hypothetical protein